MPAERLSLLRAALAQGAAGLGVALFSAFTAKAAVDASDLSGSTAVAVEMSAFLAMQISAELAIARHAVSSGVAGGVGVKPGTLLVAGLRGFPRQALLGGVTAATLVEMGVDPETYLFHGGVITGALVPDMAMAAAASALSSTAPRAAGALRWGGRALGVAGVVMLADWVAGAVWRAVDDDAEFEQALGMIAGRLAAEESGMSAVATGVELLLPTTASLAGGHWTDDRWQLQAADLMRAAAADAEVQLLSMIIGGAGTTGQPRNGESNSRHATAKMLNEAPAQDLLKTIALAAGRNRLGGASDFLGVLGEDQKATSAGVNAWMQSSLADMGARVFRTARREHALALFEHAILTKIESEGIAPAFAEVMAELADPSSGAGDILAYMGMAPAELTPLLHALLTESDVPEALQAAKGRAQRALQVMAVASRAHEIAFDVIPANAGIQENPI